MTLHCRYLLLLRKISCCLLIALLSLTGTLPLTALPVLAQDAFEPSVVTPPLPPAVDKVNTIDFTLTEPSAVRAATGGEVSSNSTSSRANRTPTEPQTISRERLAQIALALPSIKHQDKPVFKISETQLVKPPVKGAEALPPIGAVKLEGAKPAIKTLPLKITRVSSSGKINTVKEIAISFNQPMIALKAAQNVDPKDYLSIKPEPQGSYRWINSQTILFSSAKARLPRSTVYTVTVPTTTRSITGQHLDKPYVFTIETDPVSVISVSKSDDSAHGLSPYIVAQFDQSIDRATVFKMLTMVPTSGAKKAVAVRQVDDAVILSDPGFKYLKDVPKDQWLAFEPVQALPRATRFAITFAANLPSTEGPLKRKSESKFYVNTYGALKIVSYPENGCSPESWDTKSFSFSNEIDSKKFQPKMVTIVPKIEDYKVQLSGNYITLAGEFKSLTKYQVSFDKEIVDLFGQKLGTSQTVVFTTGKANPDIAMSRSIYTIPAFAVPTYSFWAQGIPRAKITLRKVKPEYFLQFQKLNSEGEFKKLAGTVVDTRVLAVGQDQKVINVSLSPFLDHGFGHFILTVESQGTKPDEAISRTAWLQVTDIGLDVLSSKTTEVLVTTLKDGKLMPGVSVKILPGKSIVSTSETGIASFAAGAASSTSEGYQAIVASRGSDSVVTNKSIYDDNWAAVSTAPSLTWYAVTDRNVYKPGETVTFKGYTRLSSYTANDALKLALPGISKLTYVATDGTGIEIAKGDCPVDTNGAFSFAMKLPEKVNLGSANLQLTAVSAARASAVQAQAKRRVITQAEEPDQEVKIYTSSGVLIDPGSTSYGASFMIQEFRRPEFELKVSSTRGNVLTLGDTTDLVATTKYFAGGVLSGSPINWSVIATNASYNPPGWSQYSFGITPGVFGRGDWDRGILPPQSRTTKQMTSMTGADGTSTVALQLDKNTEWQPTNLHCTAQLSDVNRQSWSDNTDILVHPSKYYVGLKPGKTFYPRLTPLDYKVIVVDKDGKAVSGKTVSIKLYLLDGEKSDTVVAEQNLQSADKELELTFKAQPGGNYKVEATIADEVGRKQQTVINTWVQGKDPTPVKTIEMQSLQLVPDKDGYQPGDTARVMVLSPFYPAQGLVTVRRRGVVSKIPLVLTTSSQIVEIPVTSDYFANFTVHAHLSGKDCAYAAGQTEIKVQPLERTLDVTATTPHKDFAPGSDTTIDIEVKDHSGAPVSQGQVAVAVVDDSVLALSGYSWSDLIAAFYPAVSFMGDENHSREDVILADVKPVRQVAAKRESRERYADRNVWELQKSSVDPRFGQSNEVGRGGGDAMAAVPPPSALPAPMLASVDAYFAPYQPRVPVLNLRTDLSALALFEPGVITDATGKATVKLHLPDSLTSYRIMVLAVSGGDHFGNGSSSVTARLPLAIKPSAPRFLNFGDRCEVPVVVQNQSDTDLDTEVVLRADNATLTAQTDTAVYHDGNIEMTGKVLKIPAHDRVEVRYQLATRDIGQVSLQCAAISGDKTDAATFEIPVQVPASSESTAVYGQINGDAREQVVLQKLELPDNIYDELGGLTVTTSSTAMQGLLDSYIYLRNYGYNCSEQLSSRIIATLSLQTVLAAFGKIDDKDRANIRQQLQKDIEQILSRQNPNGGFGLWRPGERETWPFVTLQVVEALDLAKASDYKIDPDKLARAHALLKNFASEIPAKYPEAARQALNARLLNLRDAEGDTDARGARALIDRALAKVSAKLSKGQSPKDLPIDQVKSYLPLESAAWLLPVVAKDKASGNYTALLRRYIDSCMVETASTASVRSSGYGLFDYCLFYSTNRGEATVLDALMRDNADNPLIPKLAKGLLSKRRNGLWDGPQENHVILKVLQKYFATYEKQTPDFVARLWLNDTFASEQTYKGRTIDSKSLLVPVDYLRQNKVGEMTLSKTGPGRLYYRMALDYTPKDMHIKAADYGFVVERSYEAIGDKSDVRLDQDGVWHFKAGAAVKAKIKFVCDGARYHVALRDPLPAGAEPVNGELAGSGVIASPVPLGATDDRGWWGWPWYEHQNLRDNQAEAFSSELGGGTYEYTYTMRATTPGEFNVPPAKVEEMYETETFGRSHSERVLVEAR